MVVLEIRDVCLKEPNYKLRQVLFLSLSAIPYLYLAKGGGSTFFLLFHGKMVETFPFIHA